MALRAPRKLFAVASLAVGAAIVVAACTSDRSHGAPVVVGESHDHGNTGTVAQDLSSNNFVGTSLPAKTLALTFDDGPGPRTAELSQYLKAEGIKAAFFMNGARINATALPNPNAIGQVANPAAILAQVLADGHLVANHTTTHRDLQTEVPDGQRVQEVTETDSAITGYVSPPNHLLFRAPYGSYGSGGSAVFNTLSASPMNKYIGPIYWEAGGFDTGYPSKAADWACWQGKLRYGNGTLVNLAPNPAGYATTQQCGDAYLTEINDDFGKGIVLMHDPYSWANGSTVDMVKYMVPILKGQGYSFVRVDEVPTIAAALPPSPCDPTCATCSGPGANQCTTCPGGRYKSGGQCLACTTCGANQYQVSACTTTADAVCGACNAGCATCSGPGAAQCTSCAANKYLNGGQCLGCSACGASQYQAAACSANANTVCGACDASCGTCTGPGAAACSSCTANKFLSGGACTACSVCGAGSYQAAACTATANTVCGACDASCTACSGPNPDQCGSCPASFYVSGGKCNACADCAAGTYQATACTTSANTSCTPCAAGSFTSVAGATTCTKCQPGTSAPAGAKSCAPCPAGQIAAAAGTAACSVCPEGTFAAAGASACSPCPAGTTAGPGATACTATACGSCDDGNACTQDRCDATGGCVHEPIASCGGASSSSTGGPVPGASTARTSSTPDDGCSVSRGLGRSGRDERDRGMWVLAALGVSILVRRRRQEVRVG